MSTPPDTPPRMNPDAHSTLRTDAHPWPSACRHRLSAPIQTLPAALAAALLALMPTPAGAETYLAPSDSLIDIAVPDGDLSGLARTITVSTPLGTVADINVRLHLAPGDGGAFAGDLYVALVHGDRAAVLLNRPGREPGRPFGYSDSKGVSILLDDQSPLGDVHAYRTVLSRNPDQPLRDVLTGAWKPDARAIDPLEVSLSHPREAPLAVFTGMPVEGDWNLFIADTSGGGIAVLQAWSLEITAVPEPRATAVAATVALAGIAGWRRMRRRTGNTP